MARTPILLACALASVAAEPAKALIAYDEAANYASGWTNGANEGYGFAPWLFLVSEQPDTNTPPAYYAGAFIGDPNDAGISGMGTNAFGLYANPHSPTPPTNAPSASVIRPFANPMSVGDKFSFRWGLNWDAGYAQNAGSKGFVVYSGGWLGDQLFSASQGGFPGALSVGTPNGGGTTEISYGTGPMTWTITMDSATSLTVTSTARDGSSNAVFTTNYSVTGAPDAIGFSAYNLESEPQRQPYFNNLQIVPEPSTSALFFSSLAGWLLWRLKSKRRR